MRFREQRENYRLRSMASAFMRSLEWWVSCRELRGPFSPATFQSLDTNAAIMLLGSSILELFAVPHMPARAPRPGSGARRPRFPATLGQIEPPVAAVITRARRRFEARDVPRQL